MKKLFISLPMGGKETTDILARMDEIKQEMEKELGFKVKLIDSLSPKWIAKTNPGDSCACLADSIKKMSKADIVVFDYGYKNTRGCKLEYEVAKTYEFADRYIIRKDGRIQQL